MKKAPLLTSIENLLFDDPTPTYSLLALLAMMLGAGIVYGTGREPGLVTHLAMLATVLCTSRIFNYGLLQRIWLLIISLISLLVVLDLSAI